MGKYGKHSSIHLLTHSLSLSIAPEVMCRQPHTFAVDYFALGVIAFEFMLGRVSGLETWQ